MRKLAIGAWSSPNDPSVNVQLDLDVTKLVAYLDTQPGITLKHALVKIFSTTIHNVPELNTVLIRSKFRQRLNNRIFIPTVFRHRSVLDLNGIAIDDAHAMSLTNLKSTWDKKISDLRSGADRPIHRVAAIFKRLPSWLCRPAIKLVEFIQYTCNVSLGAFGLPNDRFGSMTITFLDKYDIKYAAIPIYSFSRSPITLAIGKTIKEGDKKIVPVTCTFDHRCFDGFEGSLGIKELKKILNQPQLL